MLYRSDNIKMHRDFGFSQDNTNIYQIIYVEKNMKSYQLFNHQIRGKKKRYREGKKRTEIFDHDNI